MPNPLEKSSDRDVFERMRRESAEQDLRGAVERMIDEAQKKGVFDDLPGKGKPLQLGKNRHAGERALAFNLLQNNNYTLPWIAARQEILSAVYTFRGELAESWIAYQHELDAATGDEELQQASERWQAEKDRLLAELREINQTISALNLTIPVERLEVLKLHWQNELDRLGAND